MLRKDQVFLLVCLGYIGGVFAGSFFMPPEWLAWGMAALLAAVATVFPRKNLFIGAVPLAAFMLGVWGATDTLARFQAERISQGEGEVTGVARVVNDPEDKERYQEVVVKMLSCASDRCPQEKILWQAPRIAPLAFGARVSLSCALEAPKNFDPAFDYRMFLAKDDIGYVCRQASQVEVLPEDTQARISRLFFVPKRAFETALGRSLPQPEAGLAAGLIIGGSDRLPETLQQSFISAGLSHIVAISGYNIALIAQGLVLAGIGIGLWRRQALWFAAGGIILFIILVGAPASAARAGIMGLCAFAALFSGRLSRSVNLLLFAATGMLFFQPLLLRYDIGFQLSFLATLGIIAAAPYMARLLSKEFFGKSFVEIALLTLAVELFVVPLLIYQFHIFSPYALLANILLLPLVPYAMGTAFISALAFVIWPGLHLLPAGVAYLFLRSITFVAEQVSVFPGATVELSIGVPALILWYALLFSGIVMTRNHFHRRYVQLKTKDIS